MLESLVKSGALDSLGARRSQMLAVLEKALDLGRQVQADKESLQLSLFDMGMTEGKDIELELPDIPEYSHMELLTMEKEMIGFFVSGHPLEEYRDILKNIATHQSMNLAEARPNAQVKMGGMITQLEKKLTKQGNAMAIFNLEDTYGSVRAVMFPRPYEEYKANLLAGEPVLATGKVKVEENSVSFLVDSVFSLREVELMDAPAAAELKPKPVEERRSYPRNKITIVLQKVMAITKVMAMATAQNGAKSQHRMRRYICVLKMLIVRLKFFPLVKIILVIFH